jgi:hypothetical protein
MIRFSANGLTSGGCQGFGGSCTLAGAGYDISASAARASSAAQGANVAADTIFNFGSGSAYGGTKSQTNTPSSSASASAARNLAGDTSAENPGAFMTPGGQINWKLVGAVAAGVAAVGLLAYVVYQNR